MTIVLLDYRTINKIAAGEVVDCPASVVKELIENSIDANSTEIIIKIESGGRNLIEVTDNGSGIDKNEMEIAFARHATSKLTNNDLTQIKYLGFRGEALSAIAAVSRIKLISKTQDTENAWSIELEGGEQQGPITPDSLERGTSIEVRDLFFATPTRLKFLKTERFETQNIIETINRLAIINYGISFSLTVDNNVLFKYSKQKSDFNRLSEIKILGKEFKNNSVPIHIENNHIEVNGYISLPTLYRGKSTLIYIFVNNRPIHDNTIIGAIRYAYSDFITKDKYPIAVLYINIPYNQVDVNVHPHKSEVRFQNKQLIYNLIVNAIKNALSHDIAPQHHQFFSDKLSFNTHPTHANQEKVTSLSENTKKQFYNINSTEQLKSNISHQYTTNNLQSNKKTSTQHSLTNFNKKSDSVASQDSLLTDQEPPLGFAVCQLHKRYIISQIKDHIIIVDQHAAHERLTYEYMKKNLEKTGIKRQVLLTPEFIELNNAADVELLINYREKLLNLGLVIDVIGNSTVIVRETPAILGSIDVKSLIINIIDSITEVGEELFLTDKIKDVCATIACYCSIRSGRTLQMNEMNSILRQMEQTHHSGQCNHGRPTYIKLHLNEIDKLFERR